jgi:hypothetical protein
MIRGKPAFAATATSVGLMWWRGEEYPVVVADED